MDDFEKEYFEKLKKIATDFKDKRRELAKSRIKMFSAALYRQLIELSEEFDILTGSGNSGLYMTKIAEIIYRDLGIKIPTILNLPIYRFKEDNASFYDNLSLLPIVEKTLKNSSNIGNIVFVDDEIMRAITAKECFNLILSAKPDIKHLNATIIAENHFFEWHYKIPKVSINFFAYSPLIQDLNYNIAHFVPEDLHEEIIHSLKDIVSYNQSMAIVVGGGLKRKDNTPYFNYNIETSFKSKIKDYELKKSKLLKELEDLVKEGLEEYKSGKIKFRF